MLQTKHACKRVIAEEKLRHWTNYVETLSGKPDLAGAWKKIKKMRSQYRRPECPLVVEGRRLVTDSDKAEALANAFVQASSEQNLPENIRERRRLYKQAHPLTDPVPDHDAPQNGPITMAELKGALASIKKVSVAAGPDGLSYRMLKELPPQYLETLLRLYQGYWESGYIPSEWKEAVVCPIPKKKKPRKDVKSYRPIALTSHVGKILERIIKRRLNTFLETNRVIPPCQAGFRRRRSVTDHLVKLGAHMRRALLRKRTLYACFFDIKQAYDSVWHHRLLEKVQTVGLNGRMYSYISAFLEGRSFSVRCGTAQSEKRFTDMGVPQGAVIAPVLFNIMLHDIDRAVGEGFTLTVYADDVAVWFEPWGVRRPVLGNRHAGFALDNFQEAVDGVQEYMSLNGFLLAANKTVFIIFSKHSVPEAKRQSIRVGGQSLTASEEIQYLGVTFHRHGTFRTQVRQAIAKARNALNLIKSVKNEAWASNPKTMVGLAVALVRSRLLYGVEAFYDITASQWKQMGAVYRTALRIALGLPRGTPNHFVYREAGVLPLQDYTRLHCARYRLRSQTVENSTAGEVKEVIRPTSHAPPGMESFREYTQPLLDRAGVDDFAQPDAPEDPVPDWMLLPPKVTLELGPCSKKEPPLYVGIRAREEVEARYSDHLQIYTDGSVGEEGIGSAFVIPALSAEGRFTLSRVSIFTAELVAIQRALQYVYGRGPFSRPIVVLSDSMAGLMAIKNRSGGREDLVDSILALVRGIEEEGGSVEFQWVPSHVGVAGNERADRAAKASASGKEALVLDLPRSYADARPLLLAAAWKGWSEEFAARVEQDCPTAECSPPSREGAFLPAIPSPLAQLVHRLRCNHWKSIFIPLKCICPGGTISFHHVLFKCQQMRDHFAPLVDAMKDLGLSLDMQTLLGNSGPEPDLRLQAARLLYSCEVAARL